MTSREPHLGEFVVIIGAGRRVGKTRLLMALMEAQARELTVPIPSPEANGTPIWSADYRNKHGRR